MKKILVTGGAGFIGSHLVQALLLQGNRVVVIDNFNDYYDPMFKKDNVNEIMNFIEDHKLDKRNFLLYEGDIRDKELLRRVFSGSLDMVVHLAAMAGVRYSIENPELYYDVNINGTLRLLESCRQNNVKKFVFASSSSVYGNNKKVPFSETDNVDNPISPYAATKKSGELLCHTYHHLYGFSIACLRFFTVIGPRQRPDLAVHKFTKLISEGSELPFYGDGASKRDYTYVVDIVQGIRGAMAFIDGDGAKYEIFNLGEANAISLSRLVETIEGELGIKARLKNLPTQPGDVDITYADIEKAKAYLGYSPTTNFEKGVKEFVTWYKKSATHK